ncbi:MAG TPA: D-alanyl-D-alanine carboxypeptidase/D-alanyl-D-alanine-endopeptidase [Frankiaceae bacterium]|nr:D-alanyl-D-alanine carboxypeptidase/D-alanyl-D-alanine-endopeptidase [Frankiaceae bacterium]
MVVALGVAAGLVGGGAGVVAYRSDGDGALPATRPSPSASPTPLPTVPPVAVRTPAPLAADAAPGPPDSPATVTRLLAASLRDEALGPRVNALVVDAATNATLFDSNAGQPAIPASTTKVFTAAAALRVLGPDKRLETRVVADGPVADGVLDGDLVVVGGGDPTLASRATTGTYPAPATIGALARQVRAAGIRRVTGDFVVDASLFDGPTLAPGWKPTYLSEGSIAPIRGFMVDGGRVSPDDDERNTRPDLAGAVKLRAALRKAGVRIGDALRSGPAPVTADTVATVQSPPVSALVERMLVRSDNELAEALARHVAIARGASADFAGVAAALAATMRDLDVDPPRLYDGSGLSRQNRVTPNQLVLLLAAAARDPKLLPVVTGMPVASFSGTLRQRFDDPESRAAAGYVRAKTGSLDNVSTLAGVIHTRGGRTLIFAFTADRLPSRFVGAAARALDEAAATLARCGCA